MPDIALPFDLTPWQLLLASLAIFIGSFVQSSIGFGLAIVAAPLLFAINPNLVPSPILIIALGLSLINLHRYRQSLEIGPLKYAIAGRIPGSLVAGFLLVWLDPDWLSVLLASIVLFAVVVSLFPLNIQPTRGKAVIAGFMSGVMGTSTAIGGPPIALLYQNQQGNSIRANLSAFFTFSSILSVLVLIPIGHFNWDHLLTALLLMPATLLGFLLSSRVVHRINKPQLRAMTLVICTLAAIVAIKSAL